MAFAYTVESPAESVGSVYMAHGTYASSAGGTGGTIKTGLSRVVKFIAIPRVSSDGTQPKVTTATPSADGDVAITSVADGTGDWVGFGT